MEDFKEQADGVRHIPSNYSKEMATKNSVVSYNKRNGIHPNVYQITVSSQLQRQKKTGVGKRFLLDGMS